jgi:hypothetical protein
MPRLNHPARALLILALTLTAAPAPAKTTDCKALTKAACQRAPACTWVDPYKRLDEVKVQGFCRPSARPDASDDD